MAVGVALAAFGQSDKLLHSKEGHDASQHPQANYHVLHVIMLMGMPGMVMMGVVIFMMGVVIFIMVVGVGGNGVGDEVEEGVAQESPRGEGQQDLEEGGVVASVLEWDAEQDEERGRTDECCGGKGVGPQLPGTLEGRGEVLDQVPLLLGG